MAQEECCEIYITSAALDNELRAADSWVVISIVRGSFSILQIEELLKNRFNHFGYWIWDVKKFNNSEFIARFPRKVPDRDCLGSIITDGGKRILNLRKWSLQEGCRRVKTKEGPSRTGVISSDDTMSEEGVANGEECGRSMEKGDYFVVEGLNVDVDLGGGNANDVFVSGAGGSRLEREIVAEAVEVPKRVNVVADKKGKGAVSTSAGISFLRRRARSLGNTEHPLEGIDWWKHVDVVEDSIAARVKARNRNA